VQINATTSKNELPQIKFTKDYKPALAKIEQEMDAEFNALRSAA
jgi:V/A-type H+-transporting ATPase subunit A